MPTNKNVLVPMDGSLQAGTALEYALELPDVNITLLTVIDPFDTNPGKIGYQSPVGKAGIPGYTEEWYEPVKEHVRECFAEAQKTADVYGITLSNDIEFGDPAHSIVRYADRHGIDHIVMATHGRSRLSRLVLGSVSETVVRRSSVPVTVVRRHTMETNRNALSHV